MFYFCLFLYFYIPRLYHRTGVRSIYCVHVFKQTQHIVKMHKWIYKSITKIEGQGFYYPCPFCVIIQFGSSIHYRTGLIGFGSF